MIDYNKNMSIPTRKVNNSQNEEDKLLEFVNEQIDKFKTYMDLGGEYSQPGFYELTEALKSWAPINGNEYFSEKRIKKS